MTTEELAEVTAALIILARRNIPPDVQELLVSGDPAHGILPGALLAVLRRSTDATPSVPAELHERLRAAYQDLEARCAVYEAVSRVDLDALDARRQELAKWAASEAERWLDPRAGSGPANEHGLKLREIAVALTMTEATPPVSGQLIRSGEGETVSDPVLVAGSLTGAVFTGKLHFPITEAMMDAGQRYLDGCVRAINPNGFHLPATFRWIEFWDAMLAARE